jgi:two-component system, NarL family, invasion response regulator UvrY
VRILIADDHPIMRRGLRDILIRELECPICGEATNADEVLQQTRSQKWDLLILDLTLPGRSGLDVLRELKRDQPELPVLVLSMHSEQQYGKRVLKAGASGYLNKESAPEELVEAMRRALTGGRYVSPKLAERLALDLYRGTNLIADDRLSDRELEVLRMFGSGRTNSQIAEALHLSVTTVSTYRARILKKLNMSTTAELIHYALSNQLAE